MPPPGRAYELVSPADDPGGVPAGVATDSTVIPAFASTDGEGLVYGATASVGATTGGTMNALIFGRRTADGWVAENGARSSDDGNTAFQYIGGDPRNAWVSPDARSFHFVTGAGSLGAPNPITSANAFSGYATTFGSLAPSVWLSQPGPGATAAGIRADWHASDDLETAVFAADVPLTADAPPSGTSAIYMARDGETTLVSRAPGTDEPFAVTTRFANSGSTVVAGITYPPAFAYRNTLSRDGRFLLFVVPVGSDAALYVRDLVDGVTRELAPSDMPAKQLTGSTWNPDALAQGIGTETVAQGYVTAASAAPVAYFRSTFDLTPEAAESTAPSKVYRADLRTGALTFVPGIDGPPVGVAPDGDSLLFLRPAGSDWELRAWSSDEPETSTLLGAIPHSHNAVNTALVRQVRTADSARVWVFTASGTLDLDRPNASPTAQQLYRWRVGEPQPTCLSCAPLDGSARFRGVTLGSSDSLPLESLRSPAPMGSTVRRNLLAQPARGVSDDGAIVAFDSPDRLVAADQNDVRDVYLWDRDAAAGEELRIVTSGAGRMPSFVLDMSADGSSVFFTTQEALVKSDVDLAYDVYVARVGGGFPDDVQGPGCSGDACRDAGTGPSAGPAMGSLTFRGRGNPAAPPRVALAVAGRRVATGMATTLRVRVSGPGRVAVSGQAIRGTGVATGRAGAYRLRVALGARARKALARRGSLTVRVRVSYRAGDGRRVSKRMALVFKKPVGKREARKGRR